MADKNEEDYSRDLEAQSLRFQTIWTNTLFERGNNVYAKSFAGRYTFRIEKSVIIWTIVGLIISFLLHFLLFRFIFPDSILLIVSVVSSFIIVVASIQLGRWSPMQASTGEDLITYIKFMTRNKISSGGFFKSKQSKAKYVTRALANHPGGKVVSGKMWLGTQPLTTAAPRSVYEQDYKTEFQFYPRGEYQNVDIGKHNSRQRFRRLN